MSNYEQPKVGQILGSSISPRLPILLQLQKIPGNVQYRTRTFLDREIEQYEELRKDCKFRPCLIVDADARSNISNICVVATFERDAYADLARMYQHFVLPLASNPNRIASDPSSFVTVEPDHWNNKAEAEHEWLLVIPHPCHMERLEEWSTFTDPATGQLTRYTVSRDKLRTIMIKANRMQTAWSNKCRADPSLKQRMIRETFEAWGEKLASKLSINSQMTVSDVIGDAESNMSRDKHGRLVGKASCGLAGNALSSTSKLKELSHERPDFSQTRPTNCSKQSLLSTFSRRRFPWQSGHSRNHSKQTIASTSSAQNAPVLAKPPPAPEEKGYADNFPALGTLATKHVAASSPPNSKPASTSPPRKPTEKVQQPSVTSKENAAPPPTPTPTKSFFSSKNDSKGSITSRKKPSRQGTASSIHQIISKSSTLSLRARFFE